MKCAKCGKELEHYPFCIQSGKYYCSGCVPIFYGSVNDKIPETITPGIKMTFVTDAIEKTIKDAKLDFSKLANAIVNPTELSKKECEKYGVDVKPINTITKRKSRRTYYYCVICKKRIDDREFRARDGRCRNCWAQVGS